MMDVASMAMYWMGMYTLLERLLPPPLREWAEEKLQALWDRLLHRKPSSDVTLRVPERSEGCTMNHLYRHTLVYVSTLDMALHEHNDLDVLREEEEGRIEFRIPVGELVRDTFRGVEVRWRRQRHKKEENDGDSEEYFTLEFPQADRPAVVPDYLEHVTRTALEIQRRNTQLDIYRKTSHGYWDSTPFHHPSTFESLALDPRLRARLLEDLGAFVRGQKLYHRLGRAWKRGYLLHGPPGTGKTSLIAAIANHLHYNVYDLELTDVTDNAELKLLLMNTTRKSIVVIEDIDCSFGLANRGNVPEGPPADHTTTTTTTNSSDETPAPSKLTLSGLLNFSDGLWSGCTEERIFIFTTNFKERLDPALLRPGRMDMHILLSYCSFVVVKKLAENYLDGASPETHPELFKELEDVVRGIHSVTPAMVAEVFLGHQNDFPDVALAAVIDAFKKSVNANKKANNVAPLITLSN